MVAESKKKSERWDGLLAFYLIVKDILGIFLKNISFLSISLIMEDRMTLP